MAEIEMEHYSRALDEIWLLRRALAYEAEVVAVQAVDAKALGKGRRAILSRSVDRMQQAARGKVGAAYSGVSRRSLDGCMEDAGGEQGLTRSQWEDADA